MEQTKEKLWEMRDRIKDLEQREYMIGLTDWQDLELRNLREKFNSQYSHFKEAE